MVILKAFSKLVATTALLFGLAGAAQAVPIFQTTSTTSGDVELSAFGFLVRNPGTYQVLVTDNGTPHTFESLLLDILPGFSTRGVSLGGVSLGGDTHAGTFSFVASTAGIYTAMLIGVPGAGAGAGQFSVSVVPEVETWVMLLVGFGLIAYQLRRKNKLNSQNMSFA